MERARNKGINIIKNTGLGGYFYVSRVEHRLSSGSFETTLEGIKTGITKKKDQKQEVSFNQETNLSQVKPKVPNPMDKMSIADIGGALLDKAGDAISDIL